MSITAGPDVKLLPGLPRRPLSPQQQLDAVRRVQAQAEQRVQLGMQLFKAAEARVADQRDAFDRVKADQEKLRTQLTEDVGKTLHQYDQWIGRIDESFTKAIEDLQTRMAAIEESVGGSQEKLGQTMARTEALLDQARLLLARDSAAAPSRAPAADAPKPVAPPQRQATAPAPAPAGGDKLYSHLLRRLRRDAASDKAA